MLIWLLANWKWLLGAAASVALTIALLFARADAAHWHKIADNQALLIAKAKQEAAEQAEANAKRLADATADYAAKLGSIQPIIVRSTDTVREYAKTDAGRAPCLAAVRASGVQQDRQALFPASTPTPAQSSAGAVQAQATGNASGRIAE